jgi:hypothetical protein
VPFPVPGLPDVIASQLELLVAVHPQCVGAITAKVPVTPSLLDEAPLGAISSVQASRPSSRTNTDWPAIVSVPLRGASDEFAVTLTFTTPLPEPVAPLVIDIQPRSDVAVHVQRVAAATFTELEPPDAPKERDVGDSV